jgi:hypothetical protein
MMSTFFEGSPTALAQHLLRNETLSAEEVRALKQELDQIAPENGRE